MFDYFDVLVVDEIGKNISGDGMDPNITATYYILMQVEVRKFREWLC